MRWERKWTFLAASLGVIAAFFVLREHWAHALGLAPYLLLLACPLMHLFHGHGGHHHDRHQGHTTKDDLS
ncbi:DUF2933 domain-containing protein [Sinorhizobium terangae]|uniref:DUF2933 domain-containing protein n=1 Tax=Sinorhizobium terangae TaxID=110322 RepID=A0A6N7LAP7_SINTE|nr:DUF2933 domain-containing protein [Sinorhizobium terangae]MBB4187008.1 hypothetical protein [Sinorhizobium terangae]MQX14360.1 DUF2933 domain-containing protein [Sinorhizobium terangae]WFU49927.1 DUF2933 domain-containing protein [Sinorhizobium terangae]